MKKFFSFILVVLLMLSCITCPAFASTSVCPRFIHVVYAYDDLQYVNGEFECFVSIEALEGSSTENITITLDKITDTQTINIATWSSLSSNHRFTFLEYIPFANPNGTYRLTVNADVIRNGVAEHIEKISEKKYG